MTKIELPTISILLMYYTQTSKNILKIKQYFKLYLKYITKFHVNKTVNKKKLTKYQQQNIKNTKNINTIKNTRQKNIIQSTLKK